MKVTNCHNVMEFAEFARRKLPTPFYDFLEGAADDGWTARRNIAAFDDYEFMPNYLVDVSKVDCSTEILGQKVSMPLYLCPTGASRMFHHQGELAAARAAAAAGTFYGLSTVSNYSLEQVASDASGPKFFQLYIFKDSGLTGQLIDRCRAANYQAMCLSVDVPVLGNRERDLKHGMGTPPRLTKRGLLSIAMHPAWLLGFMQNPTLEFANAADMNQQELANKVAPPPLSPSVTWEQASEMIKQWNGPFAIKGIMSVVDAKKAVDIGATCVMVSNHGGRQLDGVPAPIDVVGDIAEAVGDRIEVLMDGGIRRGTHVLKALARGAKAVGIGRPYLYGLAAAGEPGVKRVLDLLRWEIKRDMALLGRTRLDQINGTILR
jgi:L-lactate dehydrogenase (cytochrome)